MYFQPYWKRISLLSRVYNKWSYFSLSSSLSLCFYAFKCFDFFKKSSKQAITYVSKLKYVLKQWNA